MPTLAARELPELLRMTTAERAYLQVLEARRRAGLVRSYLFEGLTLRLGYRLTYTPDFLVEREDGALELHEVKATWRDGRPGWREDARVKFKAAAERFPMFRFVAAIRGRDGRGWRFEQLPPEPKERKKR